ncbi:hypothetical protein RB195_017162 [Necator americanus]|uniref:LIM zinc-binding domain-containing protein n=1 Tax=Necator americanus TaxID=51031 RepID=A0ABR1C3X8_NECAM
MTNGTRTCAACNSNITQETTECKAMGKIFHVNCFKCKKCGIKLASFSSYYRVDDYPLCESCYQDTMDKCNKCQKPITDTILRARCGTFHPKCFVCANCQKSLEDARYTTDLDGYPHCMPCFHERFGIRCVACKKCIVPEEGSNKRVRVFALNQNYHPSCFKCESCGINLCRTEKGGGCIPFDVQLYCKKCYFKCATFGGGITY